jgi:putative SOS response-associated peptidase YedK
MPTRRIPSEVKTTESFFQPCWETRQQVPWCFRKAIDEHWGLAGPWNVWADSETGELVESYTMLTLNADARQVMSRLHRLDPKRAQNIQGKRRVIPIAMADANAWLIGTLHKIGELMLLAPADVFEGAPAAA